MKLLFVVSFLTAIGSLCAFCIIQPRKVTAYLRTDYTKSSIKVRDVFSGKRIASVVLDMTQPPGSSDTFIMDADGSHKKRLIRHGFGPNWGAQPSTRSSQSGKAQ